MMLIEEAKRFNERLSILKPLFREAREICLDAQRRHLHFWSGWRKSWITDQTHFSVRFGDVPTKDRYGNSHWHMSRVLWDSKGRLPDHAPDHEKSINEEKWRHIISIKTLIDDRELDRKIEASKRFLNSRPAPIAHLIVDGHADPTILQSHLQAHRGSKPSKKWMLLGQRLTKEIGHEAVSEMLSRWVSRLVSRDLSWVNWQDVDDYWDLRFILFNVLQDSLLDVRDSDEAISAQFVRNQQLVARTALRLVGEWPIFIDANWSVPQGSFEMHRGHIADYLEREFDLHLDLDTAGIVQGAIWMMSMMPEMVPTLEELGAYVSTKVRDQRPGGQINGLRSKKCTNAVHWALEQIDSVDARKALARLKLKMTHGTS